MAMSHSAVSLWVGDVLAQLLKVVMLFTVKSLLSPGQLFLEWQLWSYILYILFLDIITKEMLEETQKHLGIYKF